jgi:hypothetical protein
MHAHNMNGEVRVERILTAEDGTISFQSGRRIYPIHYEGLAVESLGVVFEAPDLVGEYRVAYYPVGATEPLGSDELFVQQAGP